MDWNYGARALAEQVRAFHIYRRPIRPSRLDTRSQARLSVLIRRDVLELDFPGRDEDAYYGALLDQRDLAPKIWGAIVEYEGLEGMSEWSVRALARACGRKTVGHDQGKTRRGAS